MNFSRNAIPFSKSGRIVGSFIPSGSGLGGGEEKKGRKYVVQHIRLGFFRRALCYRCRSYILFRTCTLIIRAHGIKLQYGSVHAQWTPGGWEWWWWREYVWGTCSIHIKFRYETNKVRAQRSARNKIRSPDNSTRSAETRFAGSWFRSLRRARTFTNAITMRTPRRFVISNHRGYRKFSPKNTNKK